MITTEVLNVNGKEVEAVTPAAEELGVKVGMTGAEVCAILNE